LFRRQPGEVAIRQARRESWRRTAPIKGAWVAGGFKRGNQSSAKSLVPDKIVIEVGNVDVERRQNGAHGIGVKRVLVLCETRKTEQGARRGRR